MPAHHARRPFALLLLLLAGCGGHGNSAAKIAPAVPVTVTTAQLRAVPLNVEAVGTVEALATVAVKSRVDGQIVEVAVSDGQEVRRGDLLFRIDPRPFEILLRQAEANLARDRAAFDNAKLQEHRYAELLKQNYVSAEGYAQVRTNLDAAAAVVQADEAARDNARLQLDYSALRAPIAGRAGKVMVQRGNLVKANDAEPLLVLNQMSPIYVGFSVPERTLADVRAAAGRGPAPVLARDPRDPAATLAGQLSFVDNAVDSATGTLRLRARFANADRALWPGQFASVTLNLGHDDPVLTVPAQAVQSGPKGPYVFVIGADQGAALRPVTVARTTPEWALIAQGLAAGERVVVDGQSRLTPGARVQVKGAGATP